MWYTVPNQVRHIDRKPESQARQSIAFLACVSGLSHIRAGRLSFRCLRRPVYHGNGRLAIIRRPFHSCATAHHRNRGAVPAG